jgi:hypothetical protein
MDYFNWTLLRAQTFNLDTLEEYLCSNTEAYTDLDKPKVCFVLPPLGTTLKIYAFPAQIPMTYGILGSYAFCGWFLRLHSGEIKKV